MLGACDVNSVLSNVSASGVSRFELGTYFLYLVINYKFKQIWNVIKHFLTVMLVSLIFKTYLIKNSLGNEKL
jgi:hypothetical protein